MMVVRKIGEKLSSSGRRTPMLESTERRNSETEIENGKDIPTLS